MWTTRGIWRKLWWRRRFSAFYPALIVLEELREALNNASNHGPCINLDRVFVLIVPVIILALVEGKVYVPKDGGAAFVS